MFTKAWKLVEGEQEYGPMSITPSVAVGADAGAVLRVGLDVCEAIDEPVSRVLVASDCVLPVDDESCRRST